MDEYQISGSSNVENSDDIELTDTNNKILIQIIDVSDKTIIEEMRHKTLIEEIKHKEQLEEIRFNEVKAK